MKSYFNYSSPKVIAEVILVIKVEALLDVKLVVHQVVDDQVKCSEEARLLLRSNVEASVDENRSISRKVA